MENYFSLEAMVRGYHIYKEVWESNVGERLACETEQNNSFDMNAVAVIKSSYVVSHLPRKISLICSLFLRRSGCSINCEVISEKRYSRDLPQGGLEIPCLLYFSGNSSECKTSAKNVEKLLKIAMEGCLLKKPNKTPDSTKIDPPPTQENKDESCWIKHAERTVLTFEDKDAISTGEWLSDVHINFSQELLRKQYGDENSFHSTLLLTNEQRQQQISHPKIQIIHINGNHWIVVSNVFSADKKVESFMILCTTASIHVRYFC